MVHSWAEVQGEHRWVHLAEVFILTIDFWFLGEIGDANLAGYA